MRLRSFASYTGSNLKHYQFSAYFFSSSFASALATIAPCTFSVTTGATFAARNPSSAVLTTDDQLPSPINLNATSPVAQNSVTRKAMNLR
jgi:hypothetical protein